MKILNIDMKRFKSFFVCLTFGVAQIHAQTAYKEIKPSVNAQQFITAASGDNSLHTGQLSVSIPLFNLEDIGINVPISLYFSGEAVTSRSEASHVGLGWSLLAGGVITQTIRGNNDLQRDSRNDTPWQYQGDWLQRKWEEQENNSYSDNVFDMALEYVPSDGEPDVFKYSFLGYSGDICLKREEDASVSWKLYPDMSFRLERTAEGFKIVANDGIEYLFEDREHNGLSNHTTSWFLTRINTLRGNSVFFHYADEYSYDNYPGPDQVMYNSKRLIRISYYNGYVVFTAADRGDKTHPDIAKKPRRITKIALYDNEDSLVKGYEFDHNYHTGDGRIKLKLNSIREYHRNGQYLPPYEFEYDYYVAIQESYPFPVAKNTWLYNPAGLASVDRNFYGNLIPWMEWSCYDTPPFGQQCRSDAYGIITTVDPIGHTINDYLCLTKMKSPAGGTESYYYERHSYGYFSNAKEPIPSIPSVNSYIMGKRLWKKEISDEIGNTKTVLYKYELHDENYQPRGMSSGVLVNPSIHTSTKYKPINDKGKPRLAASPFVTLEPQNSLTGSPIYYSEVEEVYLSGSGAKNGKKIYYFHPTYAVPATNYVYLNYNPAGAGGTENHLIRLPNTLYGKQQYPPNDPDLSGMSNLNFTYMAYPVGRFYQNPTYAGKVIKEVTLNANNDILKKIRNQYHSLPWESRYGLLIERFLDGSDPYGSNPRYRYLISRTQMHFTTLQLQKRTTIHYHQNDSISEEQAFTYTGLNLLKSASITQSNGKKIYTENIYPNEIEFQTLSNLSAQASAIKKMKEINMIGTPLQTTERNGTEYVKGNFTTFKQLPNGVIGVDTIFTLGVQPGALVSYPQVNANGEVERSSNFIPHTSYLFYDESANPTTTIGNDGVIETLVWGYGRRYPIARLLNYTYGQLQSNTTFLNQLNCLDDYTVITEPDRANLLNCNQAIRNNLPDNVTITTYTHDPLVGVTSQTDYNGQTTFYKYDSFNRLYRVYDHDGNILNEYHYNYKK